jgi:regulator of protease activity HflC (stomatin/prohibitin superfamily)
MITFICITFSISFFIIGIRIVKKCQCGSIERLGKHKKLVRPGFHWLIPVIDKIYLIDLKDQLLINEKLSHSRDQV